MDERKLEEKRNRAERNRRIGKEIQFFFLAVLLYLVNIFILYGIVLGICHLFPVSPLVRLCMYAACLLLNAWLTKVLMYSRGIRRIVLNPKK
ncbi:MAG: hypothetical protein ACI32N_00900 [Bulleidia sp.]